MENTDYCRELPLAIASLPMQHFRQIFPPDTALEKGTMFRELYLPFEPKEAESDER